MFSKKVNVGTAMLKIQEAVAGLLILNFVSEGAVEYRLERRAAPLWGAGILV